MLNSQEMLCSAATASASASNWLDRLRSSKGFPAADSLHLEHFLTNTIPSPSPTPNSSDPVINSNSDSRHSVSAANTQTSSTSDNELVGMITNVLSDLFNMGTSVGKSDELRVKNSRKQTNPKFYAILKPANGSSLGSAPVPSASPETASSSLNWCGKNLNNANDGDDHDGVEEAEEREMLKGYYSRSEVTVIDTSCPGWKFDKLVFRRKNVWKVRDKKGKSFALGSKKRKPVQLDSSNANLIAKKKAMIPNSEDATLGDKPQVEKREEVYKETPDDIGEAPEKRLHPTRSPGKSKSSGSLGFLTGISTGKKSGAEGF